jgi:hypothetical protein
MSNQGTVSVLPFRRAYLDSRATSGEEEVDDNDQQDQAEATAAVVADTRSHVVAATTKQ